MLLWGMMPLESKKAFGFVELLGAVAIVSLLALVVITAVTGMLDFTKKATLDRKVQTLNFAVEQARIRKPSEILNSTNKHDVYNYLVENNFLIGGTY